MFFGKSPNEVSPEEAVLLAAVLPNPLKRHVEKQTSSLRKRQNFILFQMWQLGGDSYLAGL